MAHSPMLPSATSAQGLAPPLSPTPATTSDRGWEGGRGEEGVERGTKYRSSCNRSWGSTAPSFQNSARAAESRHHQGNVSNHGRPIEVAACKL
eukprot:2391379-Pyramimonas_sp.AAC.1